MTPVVLKISESMTDVDFGALDLDSDPNTPTQFGRERPFLNETGVSSFWNPRNTHASFIR